MICFFESHFLRTTSETRLKEDRGTFPCVLRPVTALKRKAGKLFALLFWAKMALEKQVRNSKVKQLTKKMPSRRSQQKYIQTKQHVFWYGN